MQMFKKFKIWLRAYKIMLIKADNYWWNEHCIKAFGMPSKELENECNNYDTYRDTVKQVGF